MKRIFFLLFVLVAISNTKCFAQTTTNIWTKVNIGATENLEKILISGNKTLIFSNTDCYIGTNLSNWEKIDIPDSKNICPVIFQGYIYINCKDGIYKSSDGKSWEKSASLSAMPITAITAISLAVNNKKIFAFTGEKFHIAFESTDGVNFNEIVDLQKLVFPNYAQGYSWGGCPWFGFAEAFGDTIFASGLTSMGSEMTCRSFDNGITWTEGIGGECITDMELRSYGLTSTANNHSGFCFIIHDKYNELVMQSGVFLTLKYFGSCYYGGRANGGGIIMVEKNIGNIFYPPEAINRLESNEYYIIAVGEKGTVYVIKNDFTDYLLSAKSPAVIQSDITEVNKGINIFPNPASNILNIIAIPGETIKIIDLNGKTVKSLLATGKKSLIDIGNLEDGVYIVKSGNTTAKFIKR